MAWIKTYGKARVFISALGHTPALFMERVLTEQILAGVQFVLGDLDAGVTPGAKLASQRK